MSSTSLRLNDSERVEKRNHVLIVFFKAHLINTLETRQLPSYESSIADVNFLSSPYDNWCILYHLHTSEAWSAWIMKRKLFISVMTVRSVPKCHLWCLLKRGKSQHQTSKHHHAWLDEISRDVVTFFGQMCYLSYLLNNLMNLK